MGAKSQSPQMIARAGCVKLFSLQLLVLVVASCLLLLFVDVKSAVSAVLGGLVCVIPSWFFARKVFKHSGAQAARQIMKAFYTGEAIKIAFTVILFALVFNFVAISALPFFGAFIMTQMLMWFAPLIMK